MKQTATACLEAWTSGDFDQARDLMADNVTFDGPLGHTEGADAYIDGVRQFAQNVERVEIDKVIAERGEVCVMYDLVSKQSGGNPDRRLVQDAQRQGHGGASVLRPAPADGGGRDADRSGARSPRRSARSSAFAIPTGFLT